MILGQNFTIPSIFLTDNVVDQPTDQPSQYTDQPGSVY